MAVLFSFCNFFILVFYSLLCYFWARIKIVVVVVARIVIASGNGNVKYTAEPMRPSTNHGHLLCHLLLLCAIAR